jgi:hypothetical protein
MIYAQYNRVRINQNGSESQCRHKDWHTHSLTSTFWPTGSFHLSHKTLQPCKDVGYQTLHRLSRGLKIFGNDRNTHKHTQKNIPLEVRDLMCLFNFYIISVNFHSRIFYLCFSVTCPAQPRGFLVFNNHHVCVIVYPVWGCQNVNSNI